MIDLKEISSSIRLSLVPRPWAAVSLHVGTHITGEVKEQPHEARFAINGEVLLINFMCDLVKPATSLQVALFPALHRDLVKASS